MLNLRRGRAADPGGAALLLSPGPAARTSIIREAPTILLRNGWKKLVRSLQGGEHRLTKLGKGFFRDKFGAGLVHSTGGSVIWGGKSEILSCEAYMLKPMELKRPHSSTSVVLGIQVTLLLEA